MKRYKGAFVLLSILFFLFSCDARMHISEQSGSADDDYVEEPLSNRSKKYENALNVSNDVLDKIISQDYDSIYDDIFDPQLKTELDKQEFLTLMTGIIEAFGNVKTYKKSQWGFFTGEENGQQLLYSKKIVECENSMVKFLFVFNNDGKYQKIVGLHAREREGVTPPGVF
jgi:hypothetical protein